MTNRIQEDELLRELAEDNIVRRPIIIVDVEGDKHRYRLFLAEVDQLTHQPKMAARFVFLLETAFFAFCLTIWPLPTATRPGAMSATSARKF